MNNNSLNQQHSDANSDAIKLEETLLDESQLVLASGLKWDIEI